MNSLLKQKNCSLEIENWENSHLATGATSRLVSPCDWCHLATGVTLQLVLPKKQKISVLKYIWPAKDYRQIKKQVSQCMPWFNAKYSTFARALFANMFKTEQVYKNKKKNKHVWLQWLKMM